MIIWWLFDHYLHYCDYLLHWNVNANDSPVFAFARLRCLTIPADRPARSVKIVSDLIVALLQSAPPYTSHTTAVNTSHPAQQPQPMVHQPCEGERVILDGRKRDRIRHQALARFLTRARSYARERACKLASAPIMRLYTCVRERQCVRQCCTRARGATCRAKSLADEHSMIKRSRTDAVLVTSLEINE